MPCRDMDVETFDHVYLRDADGVEEVAALIDVSGETPRAIVSTSAGIDDVVRGLAAQMNKIIRDHVARRHKRFRQMVAQGVKVIPLAAQNPMPEEPA